MLWLSNFDNDHPTKQSTSIRTIFISFHIISIVKFKHILEHLGVGIDLMLVIPTSVK